MAVNPQALEVKQTKKFDEKTILDFADYISGMIATEGVEEYNCFKAAKGFAKKTGKVVASTHRWAQRVFPSVKIKEGVTPQALANDFIANDDFIQNAKKVARAIEILKADPTTPYTVLSKKVGLPYMTLRIALGRAGMDRLSKADRGLRVVAGRDKGTGKYLGDKLGYRCYFSDSTLTAFEVILAEVGGDLEKARKKFEVMHGPEKVDRFMKLIFPAYLFEKLGVKACIDKYRAWLATKPKTMSVKDPAKFAAQQEIDRRMNELVKEHEERPQVIGAIKDTMAFIRAQVFNDPEVGNRALFLNVSRSILLGISGQNIAKRYGLDEKIVIGVRRRMIDYLYSSKIGSYSARKARVALLLKTGFYKTFDHDSWLSEPSRPFARYSERESETPKGLRVEHLDREVQHQFEKRFTKPKIVRI